VRGFVQGVGFRFALAREARSRGVVGWVRNRPDGAVEAVFEGSPEAVDSMIRSCRHGPRGARVERVQIYEEKPAGSQEFRVLG
jgi:acylphosphatase